ncbi:hypothetical protein TU76_10780 [Pseudomonas psychrophila]|nr:hypothetical protein TU76_10780 [Pseudomonas psychrophila]
MPDMYPVCQLFCEAPAAMPSPYPFDMSRLSTGSALTAGHFFQTPKKSPKRLALPYGRLAQARWFPHSGTVMGIRVVWTYVWLQQKQKQKQKQNPWQTPQNLAQNV